MDFVEKGFFDFLKKSSKTGDRITAISDIQNNEECVSFHLGGGKFI